MKVSKYYFFIIIAAFLILVGVGALVWRQTESVGGQTNQDLTTVLQNKPETETNTTITIENFQFMPQELRIKTGSSVTWVNKDSVPHNIEIMGVTSPTLNQNEEYSFTFNSPGTIDYICGLHPSMKAKIIVE